MATIIVKPKFKVPDRIKVKPKIVYESDQTVRTEEMLSDKRD